MYRYLTALAVVGTLCPATPAHADSITLAAALERAAHRPRVQSAELGVDEARARARGAVLPLYNPELTAAAGPQFGTDILAIQGQIGLQQTLERGGKRAARTRLAEAEARSAELDGHVERLHARIETWRAFERALVLRERLATRQRVEALAIELVAAMQKSAAAGGATRLRVNLVLADAGRATQQRLEAERDLAAAQADLALAIGAAPQESVEPSGDVVAPPRLRDTVDELVTRVLREHPDLRAIDNEVTVASARVADADARGVSDVTLGLGYQYQPSPEGSNIILGSVTFALPVRNRNQGERSAARIGVKRAELERARLRAEAERRVRLAAAQLDRARAAVAAFDRDVSDRLSENLTSAQDAFAKGGLDFVELTTTRRDLVDSRLAFLDAHLALIDAWTELALVAGLDVTP